MIAGATALGFGAVAFSMALSPGPNLLYMASRAACQGRAAGFVSLAGVCTGMLCYLVAAAAGLSALFALVPLAYDAVRLAGAGYLLWLAWKVLRSRAPLGTTSQLAPEPWTQLYRRGLLTCLLNPKIVVTYGALLPQFVDPAAGSVFGQTLQLGLVQIAAAALAHSGIILTAGALARVLTGSASRARLQKTVLASMLALVALRLATARRPAG